MDLRSDVGETAAGLDPIEQEPAAVNTPEAPLTDLPLKQFLRNCHETFVTETKGHLADYIPELTKANPDHFGIAIATVDGHLHTHGDTDVPFTIQSVSKAFVFALALDFCGHQAVAQKIGVEPSGEAFNSIRLKADNRPFNPMVNAGAITCTALIHQFDPDTAFERIRAALSSFAGRALSIDEEVYQSESKTGDRNRAIAWLLKNNGVLCGDVDAALDVYFRQCALLVTARDLAVMGATLANNGINPVTGERVISSHSVAKALSVMVSSGMYDFSGEWIYRVGLPAKSGVGGGIVAALPAQLALGTYSPLLDEVGNSVRGLKVCEEVSAFFGLHLLERQGDVSTAIAADYDLGRVSSSRDRRAQENALLRRYGKTVRVLELAGALNFVAADYICRQVNAALDVAILVIDFRRVSGASEASAKLLSKLFAQIVGLGKRVVISGLRDESRPGQVLSSKMEPDIKQSLRQFPSLSDATGWSEDQVIYTYGGFDQLQAAVNLSEQPLVKSLSADQFAILQSKLTTEHYRPGNRIIEAGTLGDTLYFLERGMVSVSLSGGVRVACIEAGNCFGEMILLSNSEKRSAHIDADTEVQVQCLSLDDFNGIRIEHPDVAEILMRNMAQLLAERLRQANNMIDALGS